MVIVNNNFKNEIFALNVKDKLTKEDLDNFAPILKKQFEETRDPHLMMILEDSRGWEDAAAFWKDIRLDAGYVGSFDRIATVDEEKRTRLMDLFF